MLYEAGVVVLRKPVFTCKHFQRKTCSTFYVRVQVYTSLALLAQVQSAVTSLKDKQLLVKVIRANGLGDRDAGVTHVTYKLHDQHFKKLKTMFFSNSDENLLCGECRPTDTITTDISRRTHCQPILGRTLHVVRIITLSGFSVFDDVM